MSAQAPPLWLTGRPAERWFRDTEIRAATVPLPSVDLERPPVTRELRGYILTRDG